MSAYASHESMQHHDAAAFDALLAALAGTAPGRRRQLVDDWTLRHPVSPLIGADEAVIWYFGRARDVVLRGDMLGERSAALARLPGTDLWFHRARYELDTTPPAGYRSADARPVRSAR